MRILDLFSGIGGFSLGLERAGMETVAFCEFDKNAQLVLKKHWPDVPIYDDVRELTYEQLKKDGILSDTTHTRAGENDSGVWEGVKRIDRREGADRSNPTNDQKGTPTIDLICGGFPCQPFSHAGKREGADDDRHLWPEYFRIIQEIRPRWVIGENVAGLISMGLDQVLSDLESEDYSCQTLIIPACALNAPHRRDRVWIIGRKRDVYNSECNGLTTSEVEGGIAETVRKKSQGQNNILDSKGTSGLPGTESDVAHSISQRGCGGTTGKQDAGDVRESSGCSQGGWWDIEPDVGRVAHGIPNRVDRLKQLGNAVVPQVVEEIGRAIMKVEHEKVPERILCHQ